uniref:Uncharacterized protein n=1 Tax=Favella ehrenbergii TaxID=182087 RepID=A0A7S3I6V5_9SPIT
MSLASLVVSVHRLELHHHAIAVLVVLRSELIYNWHNIFEGFRPLLASGAIQFFIFTFSDANDSLIVATLLTQVLPHSCIVLVFLNGHERLVVLVWVIPPVELGKIFSLLFYEGSRRQHFFKAEKETLSDWVAHLWGRDKCCEHRKRQLVICGPFHAS